MGLLGKTVAFAQYKVLGEISSDFKETVRQGLVKNIIPDVLDADFEKIGGWSSFKNPYLPFFDDLSFVVGSYLVFSLRIDKKVVPAKAVKHEFELACEKRKKETGRDFLSRAEKKEIKDATVLRLRSRMPASPNIYELVWDYERNWLYFFSTSKGPNEDLETLFKKSFGLSLVRIFPYTAGYTTALLSDSDKERLSGASPTMFK